MTDGVHRYTRAGPEQLDETVTVDGLSLSVGAGEIFGFLGPNSAEKTTSVKMLQILVAPERAEVRTCSAARSAIAWRGREWDDFRHFRFQDTLTGRELHGFPWPPSRDLEGARSWRCRWTELLHQGGYRWTQPTARFPATARA